MLVHLMHGKEENYDTVKSKTGCGIPAGNTMWCVYWKNRKNITCPGCVKKAEKIETMRGL